MGKYDAITNLLRGRTECFALDFADLAELVPGGLPNSAYKYEAWWGNDDPTHIQSESWAAAGFRADVDLERRIVRFVPV